MRQIGSGYLNRGDIEFFQATFKSGVTYNIYVEAGDSSVDFDLYVMDENKNVVKVDDSTSSDARCSITPKWTGRFVIAVKSARGSSSYKLYIG